MIDEQKLNTLENSVPENFVFVFGSNLSGIHGAGAAKAAHERWGAKMGEGVGRTGMSYAIPTKNAKIETLTLDRIEPHIEVFIDYAKSHNATIFLLSHVGCGYAGYSWDKHIRPLFPEDLPTNVILLEAKAIV